MLVKMKAICTKVGSGATPKGGNNAYIKTGITLIRSQNIHDFYFSHDGLAHINDEQAAKLNGVRLEEDDVLLNITGDSVARACKVDNSVLPARVNQHVCIVRGDKRKVLSSYVLYYLQMKKPELLMMASSGATRNALTKGMIEELELDLPSLQEQKKIVSLLDDIQCKILNNNRINRNLSEQAQAYFDELFIQNASAEWKEGTLSDVGSIVAGGTPFKSNQEYYTDNGIAWITPKDLSVDKSVFISHGENDITELGLQKSSATMMPAGTVLFSSRAPIGYIAIAANDICTNQGFKSVVPNDNVGTSYVYYLLKQLLPTIENMASGSTFKEISGSAMKIVPIAIPDDETLKRFSDFCDPIMKQIQKNEQESKRLVELRDSLLPKLMSGDLDVSDLDI